MSDEPRRKGWGKTVLGWFVEAEDEPAAASAAELIARYGGEAAASPVQLDGPPPLPAPGGTIDFDGVYRAAGLSDAELEHVRKAGELLRNLPQDTPLEIKRQIVEASLKAFGYPTEKIIEAGAQEIQALHAYITQGQIGLQQLLQESSQRLAALEQEMQRIRQVMQQSTEQQSQVAYACNLKKLEIQDILQFFGQEAVEKVVRESPKLHEPQG
ncbi:MAG: hypothetical protein HY906_14410 [Deltaproteobacteria bacterium]|nr:hypothetical protein [Deltaproteobacteria bacterium]